MCICTYHIKKRIYFLDTYNLGDEGCYAYITSWIGIHKGGNWTDSSNVDGFMGRHSLPRAGLQVQREFNPFVKPPGVLLDTITGVVDLYRDRPVGYRIIPMPRTRDPSASGIGRN